MGPPARAGKDSPVSDGVRAVVAEIADLDRRYSFRSGIVSAGRVDGRVARAAVTRGLLTKHTLPHKGYRLTDKGYQLLAERFGDPVGIHAEDGSPVYRHPDHIGGDRPYTDVTGTAHYARHQVVFS
jgi:hypothetical protein